MTVTPFNAEPMSPFHALRFEVTFEELRLTPGQASGGAKALCSGSFSECSGLEATMEPKVIKEGGRNYGAAQRVGKVSFGNVVLKRGITSNRDLWRWFELVSGRASAYRLTTTLKIRGPEPRQGDPVMWQWQLKHCLPVKFRVPTANASSNEIAIEELHLAHEGLFLIG